MPESQQKRQRHKDPICLRKIDFICKTPAGTTENWQDLCSLKRQSSGESILREMGIVYMQLRKIAAKQQFRGMFAYVKTSEWKVLGPLELEWAGTYPSEQG